MVATFAFIESNATAGDTGVPTNINLGSTNSRNLAASTYPIAAGSYSYSKWIQGMWSGTFTRIEGVKFWMSDSGTGYASGEALLASVTTTNYSGTSTFSTPTTTLDAQSDNTMPTSEPASANVGIGGNLSGSITTSAAGSNRSDFIVIQASITSSVTPGAASTKTFTLEYTEV